MIKHQVLMRSPYQRDYDLAGKSTSHISIARSLLLLIKSLGPSDCYTKKSNENILYIRL